MSCHDGIPASRKRLPPEWQDLQTARALGPGNKSRDDSLRQRLWTTAVPRPTFRGMTQQDGDYRDDPHEDFGEEAGSRLGRARRYAQVGTSVGGLAARSEEHTSELQSLMRISYAVFCLKKKTYYT